MHLLLKSITFMIAGFLTVDAAVAREVIINAVGDILLTGSCESFLKKNGYDYPFAATAAELQRGDITVGNLEAPLSRGGCEFKGKRFRFRGDPRIAPALKKAGFRVVTLANNHLMDYGESAMEETVEHLRREGIAYAGAGKTLAEARKGAVINANGVRVAFLAYSFTFPPEFYATADRAGTAPGFARIFSEDIATARRNADYVAVSFHWGREWETAPLPYQITAAHGAIDAGADLVIGHHPHVLQGVERYKRGVIFYSLGNFAFSSYSRKAMRSVIARVTMDNGVKEVELIPLNVCNREVRFQPKPLSGKEKEEVIGYLSVLSKRWGTSITATNGRFLVGEKVVGNLAKR